ncbi:MAG: hypothetical protein SVZ03_12290 [Spirochaetota bacterium]|nr:hypothetical protein [Spirochaetota bacterium]
MNDQNRFIELLVFHIDQLKRRIMIMEELDETYRDYVSGFNNRHTEIERQIKLTMGELSLLNEILDNEVTQHLDYNDQNINAQQSIAIR